MIKHYLLCDSFHGRWQLFHPLDDNAGASRAPQGSSCFNVDSVIKSLKFALASGFHELRVRPTGQVPALDALRSFAILLVVFHHWAVVEYLPAGGGPVALQRNPLFYYGWSGVDLFFVLSGFLIGRQLWRELDRTGTIRLGRFILRRGLRIWPIYFAMLLYYLLTSATIHARLSDWFFFSNYRQGGFVRGWSLSTEEQFYIAVPLLLLLVRRRIPMLGYLGVLGVIEGAVLLFRNHTIHRLVAIGAAKPDYVLVYPFHTHLEGLLAGLVIALLSVVRPSTVAPDTSSTGFSKVGFLVFAGASALGLVLRQLDHQLFSFVVLALIFGGATYWALRDRSIVTRWMSSGFWYPISRLSYSMYLNHWWVAPQTNRWLVEAMKLVFPRQPTAVFVSSMLLGTVVSFLAAGVMFLLIEHPFLLLRDRVLTFTRRPAPVSAPATADPVLAFGQR